MLVLDRMPVTAALAASDADATYRREEVRVPSPSSPNSEVGLGDTLSMPLGAEPFPAVVLLSDIGTPEGPNGTYSLLNELADYPTLQGLAVLRLDDRDRRRGQRQLRVANSSPMPNQH